MIPPFANNTTSKIANPRIRSNPPAAVQVGVIDSGVERDLVPQDRLAGVTNFVNGRTEPYDDHGQGTHLAGCIAGLPYIGGSDNQQGIELVIRKL